MTKGGLVELWFGVFRHGSSCLTDAMFDHIEPELSPGNREIVRHLAEQLHHDKKWIDERTEAMRGEADRIAVIGKTMLLAGLRSYTDEKGRIYVAERTTQAEDAENFSIGLVEEHPVPGANAGPAR